jgi:hypothetical protein
MSRAGDFIWGLLALIWFLCLVLIAFASAALPVVLVWWLLTH